MAMSDYYLCDVCDRKAFYDADIIDDTYLEVDMKVVCTSCKDKYTVEVIERENLEQDEESYS